jgi:hypothetical protein
MLNKRDLEEYISLVGITEKKKSPSVSLPVANARRVADGLSFLLLELSELQKTLEDARKSLSDNTVTSIELDGGSFK